jgi:hypothetical protein
MSATNIRSKWVSGNLVFYSRSTGETIMTIATGGVTIPDLTIDGSVINDAGDDHTITIDTATDEAANRALTIPELGGDRFIVTSTAALTQDEADVLDGAVAGDPANEKALVGGAADDDVAFLDFSAVTLAEGANLIRGVALDIEDTTGYLCFQGNTTTGSRYASYWQQETDGDAKMLGLGVFPFIKSGGASDRMQALSSVMTVDTGGTLEDRSGDATAGAHNVWAKFGMDLNNATFEAGGRVAPMWSDIQINNGDVSDEEIFQILCSAGGSAPRALIRQEGVPVYFLETDTALGTRMLASTGYEATNTNAPAGFLKVNLNGTVYGIPLMAAS